MTVAELRQRLSTHEFAQWVAFYRIEAREREAEQRKQAAAARTRRHR
ncbi:MAG: hypothetical protein AB7G23_21020 [Vicinamibacterales bacterium]